MRSSCPRLGALWCLLLVRGPGRVSAAAALALPGPAPQQRQQSPAGLNKECEKCHPAIAREWRDSYHRLANQDPAFQRALAREPAPFCRRCHAPEADPSRDATGWAAENGVACVTCHVLDGQIVSGNVHPGKPAPHPLRRDARLAEPAACARCHEFQFPDGRLRRRPEFMQLTLTEHRAAADATTSCVSCHMPRVPDGKGGSHRSHQFLGGHDELKLRAALHVQAVRHSDRVTLHLTPQHVGHALPTGDLFRRLVLQLQVDGEPNLPGLRRDLMRHFEAVQELPGKRVRVTASDDRLTGPTAISFPLPPQAQNRPVRWQVTYERVAFPFDQRGGQAAVDGAVVLDSGTLAPSTAIAVAKPANF